MKGSSVGHDTCLIALLCPALNSLNLLRPRYPLQFLCTVIACRVMWLSLRLTRKPFAHVCIKRAAASSVACASPMSLQHKIYFCRNRGFICSDLRKVHPPAAVATALTIDKANMQKVRTVRLLALMQRSTASPAPADERRARQKFPWPDDLAKLVMLIITACNRVCATSGCQWVEN